MYIFNYLVFICFLCPLMSYYSPFSIRKLVFNLTYIFESARVMRVSAPLYLRAKTRLKRKLFFLIVKWFNNVLGGSNPIFGHAHNWPKSCHGRGWGWTLPSVLDLNCQSGKPETRKIAKSIGLTVAVSVCCFPFKNTLKVEILRFKKTFFCLVFASLFWP